MLKNTYQKKRIFSQAAFTLIEMLVVFAIVAILSFLMMASYRAGQKRYALSQAAQQLASDFRRAQNMAMGGVDIAGQYCGYGIELNPATRPTSYRFYADKSADCTNTNNRYDGNDDILEEINLPSGVGIQKVQPPPLDIFFKPPDPTTYRNGNPSTGLSGAITLEIIDDPTATKLITVTTAGRIQVD